MVSGLAPGRLAVTNSVGRSTFGRSLTANSRYATVPKRAIAAIIKLVAMGLSMKAWEMFMSPREAGHRSLWPALPGLRPAEGFPQKPGTREEYPALGCFFDPANPPADDKNRSSAPRSGEAARRPAKMPRV